MKHTYYIKGMSCQGCRKHVEQSLSSTPGVEKVSVDLELEEAQIEFNTHIPLETLQEYLSANGGNYRILTSPEDNHSTLKESSVKQKEQVLKDAQYYCPMQCEGDKTYPKPGDCPICGMDLVPMATASAQEQSELKVLSHKFLIAIVFTVPIFIIAMSEMIPDNPLFVWLPQKYWNWIQLLLSIPVVFYSTWMFFERAFRSVRSWNLNMFTLIGIGAGVAWLFSFTALIFPDVFPDQFKADSGTVHVYFEAATVILTLVLLGQLIEARAHSKTSSAIRQLLELAPNTAFRVEDGNEMEVNIDEIHVGDILRVKPGNKIPVDGVIIRGSSSIDESMISGEPIPVFKESGDKLISGTINGNQSFLMKAEKIGSDTLLAQIIDMVNQASRSRAPIQNLADLIAGYFVPVVVLIAIITFIIWSVWGPSPAYVYALVNAVAVLIIACPCALGLATPMSVMVGVGKGAGNGVLFKNAAALQQMSKIDTLVVDKTGTLTEGKPTVKEVIPFGTTISESDLIQYAASLNRSSEHPLADAIVTYARNKGIDFIEVKNFKALSGQGVTGMFNNTKFYLGNFALMESISAKIPDNILEKANYFQQQGNTVTFLAMDSEVAGMIILHDPIKQSSKKVLMDLQKMEIEVIMLTGDNFKTAQFVASELGISHFKAGLMPADKLEEVVRLQMEGRNVAMAGDGINDAPALAKSQVGIAMGTGTDVAIESADVTLVKGDMNGIRKAFNLSNLVMRNIKQNLFFALVYNAIGVPIAAGVLFPFIGLLLSPMIAAAAMSFSSVSVIFNALRLQTVDLDQAF